MEAKSPSPELCARGKFHGRTKRPRRCIPGPRDPHPPQPGRRPRASPPPLTRVSQLLVAVHGEDDQEVAQQVHRDGEDEDGGQSGGHPGLAARGALGRRVPREDGAVQLALVHSHPAAASQGTTGYRRSGRARQRCLRRGQLRSGRERRPPCAARLPALGRSGAGGSGRASHGGGRRHSRQEVSPRCACAAAGHFYSPAAPPPRPPPPLPPGDTEPPPRRHVRGPGSSCCRAAPQRPPAAPAPPHSPRAPLPHSCSRPLHSAPAAPFTGGGAAGIDGACCLRLGGLRRSALFLALLVNAGS